MPAVALRALRRELARWAQQPGPVETWAQALAAFFQRYANLVYRPGEQTTDLAPAYHSPPILTLELWRALRHRLPDEPAKRLALADALWALGRREPRILAARVLGTVPSEHEEAVFQRFWPWLQEARWDLAVERALMNHAAQPLLARDVLLSRLQPYLPPRADGDPAARALLALTLLPRAEGFDNTPALFHALHPGLVHLDPDLRPEWAALLRTVLARWPAETVPFLRRARALTRAPKAFDWILRRIADDAAEPWRQRLLALTQPWSTTAAHPSQPEPRP
ncbi:MAG: hypothetical protein GXO54_05280 [Chloroflexi bacterium]|nr:hypothetical protein [Chloroflexota bacterium]